MIAGARTQHYAQLVIIVICQRLMSVCNVSLRRCRMQINFLKNP